MHVNLGTPWHVAYPSTHEPAEPAPHEPYLQRPLLRQPVTQQHGVHLASAAGRLQGGVHNQPMPTCHACHGKAGDVQLIMQFLIGLLLLLLINSKR